MTEAAPSDRQLAPPEPLAGDLRNLWLIDPEVTFLNHGSFGAAPREVLEEQSRLREEMERQLILFLDRRRPEMLWSARERVGEFIGASPEDLGFVTNATEGVTAVIRSLDFDSRDEVITTTHAYDAVANTLEHVVGGAGGKVIRAPIELPYDPARLVRRIDEATTDRTRLVVIDHISSISALIHPVREIIELCDSKGIDVLVDGAHAPGMVELDVATLGAAYYTGNLHKWVCAPKGAAFLWTREDRRHAIHPTVISNYYGQGYRAEFDWQGTRDITPWLAVPKAIDFMGRFGWDRVREHNHRMVVWAQSMLCERWGVEAISPLDGAALGSMVTVPLPAKAGEYEDRHACAASIYDRYRIEVPVVDVNGRRMVRCSCQIYNRREEYERLADAVEELLA